MRRERDDELVEIAGGVMYYLNEKLIEAIQQDHLREAANARRNMIPKDPGGTAQTTSRVPSFAMGAVVPTAGKGAV